MTPLTIILDTNVLSEINRANPSPAVIAWYLEQESSQLFTTAITVAEILYGLDLMPPGKRRNHLTQLSHLIFQEGLQGKILPFDEASADRYATLRAGRRRQGLPIAALDAQIAAIALATGSAIATRNTTDFDHCGITLINPWLP